MYLKSAEALSLLLEIIQNKVILCDTNTYLHCYSKLNIDETTSVIIFEGGEQKKTLQSLELVLQNLTKLNCDRKTCLINLGGGVVTDLGGFAASVYKRGIDFVNVPTTLMAMVDAANGGKTGINFMGNKNYLGTFTSAQSVFIWPGFMESLDRLELLSGYAEMLKHGLIADPSYFKELANLNLKGHSCFEIDWLPLIKKSLEIKSAITLLDFEEKAERKFLNFGHTIGHALESYFMEKHLTHGHFVASGMICEAWLSKVLGELSAIQFDEIVKTLDRFYDRIQLSEMQIIEIAELVIMDKKSTNNTIQCVFLKQIGEAVFDKPITNKDVIESLNFYCSN